MQRSRHRQREFVAGGRRSEIILDGRVASDHADSAMLHVVTARVEVIGAVIVIVIILVDIVSCHSGWGLPTAI